MQFTHLDDAHDRVFRELRVAPRGEMRFQVLPGDALDAADGIYRKGLVRARDEEAGFGDFPVDVHLIFVPIRRALAPPECTSERALNYRPMTYLRIAVAALAVLMLHPFPALADAQTTVTGIALDAPWKASVYHLVRTSFTHPAWGWQHAERDYDVAMELAKGDGLQIDTDVLFAAAMLHDMAAFPPYQEKGEHGDVAARLSEPILRRAGFPMRKFPRVAAAMRGHMYYSDAGMIPEAMVLHDADSLDFLGAMGATRIIALAGATAPSAAKQIGTLKTFLTDIPSKLLTKTARAMGEKRVAELRAFLDAYGTESFDGALP